MRTYDTRLITPPKEEEEIYPYRRVWASVIVEMGILFGVTMSVFLATRVVDVPQRFHQPAGVALALMPVGLWLLFSWWRERFVPQPRQRLLAVMVISALTANAVSIPVIEGVFQVDRWLALESAINRIVGYSFSQGLVQASQAYLILRYVAWPGFFRVRQDAIAYAAACAVGHALVANLHIVLAGALPLDISAFRVFDTTAIHLALSIVIGFGLSEVKFNAQVFPLHLSAMLALAAFISGLATPLRSGLTNASMGILRDGGSGPLLSFLFVASPIRGVLFSAALLVVVGLAFSFLFASAERQDAENNARQEMLQS